MSGFANKRADEVSKAAPKAAKTPSPPLARSVTGVSRLVGIPSAEAVLALQRTAGNQVAKRLLGLASSSAGGVAVQRRRLPDGGAAVVALVKRLLLSGNKEMSRQAIAIRVKSEEMDKEDVQDVRGLLDAARDGTIATAAGLKEPHKANVTNF